MDPTYVIPLTGAKYELTSGVGDCPFPFLTITSPKGDQHMFTAETITEWQETLQLATKTWTPPPPAVTSPPQPQPRRSVSFSNSYGIPYGASSGTSLGTSYGSPFGGNSIGFVNSSSMLMRKSALRSSLVLSAGEQTPQDRAIVAWVNVCCSKTAIASPASIAEGFYYLFGVCLILI